MSGQPPYQPPYPQVPGYLPYAPVVPLKHSGVGVASFIISIAVGVLELVAIILAAVLVQQQSGPQSPMMVFAGCGLILGMIACVAGVVLGIIGIAQRDTKKVFAILGVCFNGLILLTVLSLMVIGLIAK